MRTSKRRTPVAVLRAEIGIKDVEMAEMLGCSPATIHSLESGRLKLSESMAVRISHETGVAVSWLLGGRPTGPVTTVGKPYTRETFERTRAKEENPANVVLNVFTAAWCHSAIQAILNVAERNGDLSLACYKIDKAVQTLVSEFCSPKDIAENDSLALRPDRWIKDGKPLRRMTLTELGREVRRARSFSAKQRRQA